LTLNWLLFCSSFSTSSPSSTSSSNLLWTFANQLQLTCGYTESIHLAEYITMVQARWGMSRIDSWVAAQLLLLFSLLLLFLQCWLPSNFCKSTPIDLWICSIDSSGRVH
jgi:hypothetical protein